MSVIYLTNEEADKLPVGSKVYAEWNNGKKYHLTKENNNVNIDEQWVRDDQNVFVYSVRHTDNKWSNIILISTPNVWDTQGSNTNIL